MALCDGVLEQDEENNDRKIWHGLASGCTMLTRLTAEEESYMVPKPPRKNIEALLLCHSQIEDFNYRLEQVQRRTSDKGSVMDVQEKSSPYSKASTHNI